MVRSDVSSELRASHTPTPQFCLLPPCLPSLPSPYPCLTSPSLPSATSLLPSLALSLFLPLSRWALSKYVQEREKITTHTVLHMYLFFLLLLPPSFNMLVVFRCGEIREYLFIKYLRRT